MNAADRVSTRLLLRLMEEQDSNDNDFLAQVPTGHYADAVRKQKSDRQSTRIALMLKLEDPT